MIHTLSRSAFAGALKAPAVTGVSPLFRAKIRIGDQSTRCYVKPQPDMCLCPVRGSLVPNQEIINEALGYVLAKSCELKVPDVAGIILLDQEQIPDTALSELRKIAPGKLQDNYLCWFSKDMSYPNLVQKFGADTPVAFFQQRRLKRLAQYLAESADTPKVIAFDDWLMNSDRHPGNLLGQAKDSLLLIDHGRILVYPNWTPGKIGMLPPSHKTTNRLRNFVDGHEPNWSAKLPRKSAMMMAYNAFALSFRDHGEMAARKVLANFFDSIDIDAVVQLLHNRHDPTTYAKSTGMVL